MRIGPKTRLMLDLAFILGMETLEGILYLPVLYKSANIGPADEFEKRIALLKERGYIDTERDAPDRNEWVGKLTGVGREQIVDGIDPEERWNASWDKQWRIFSFDLINARSGQRQALRKWLMQRRFGRLQGSVWVSARPIKGWHDEIARLGITTQSALSIRGEILGDDTDSIVRRAWKLNELNALYLEYTAFLEKPLPTSRDEFLTWRQRDAQLWSAAFAADPFLPRELWPAEFARSYAGPAAYRKRRQSYIAIGQRLKEG